MGGVDAIVSKAQRGRHNAKGPVLGVVETTPHMQRVDGEPKAPKITDLYIDIGCDSRKATEKRVRIGDPITVNQNFEILHKDIAVAAPSTIASAPGRSPKHCDSADKKQRRSLRGLQHHGGSGPIRRTSIAYSLKPDSALVVDVTHMTDYPGINKQTGDIRMGDGPTITHGIYNHPEVVKRLEQVAPGEDFVTARNRQRHQRHGYRRSFLDPRWHSQCPDKPADATCLRGRSS